MKISLVFAKREFHWIEERSFENNWRDQKLSKPILSLSTMNTCAFCRNPPTFSLFLYFFFVNLSLNGLEENCNITVIALILSTQLILDSFLYVFHALTSTCCLHRCSSSLLFWLFHYFSETTIVYMLRQSTGKVSYMYF
jgi:hypothetical protein